jgi:hypothetical protein
MSAVNIVLNLIGTGQAGILRRLGPSCRGCRLLLGSPNPAKFAEPPTSERRVS